MVMQKVLILLCSTRKKNKLSRYYSFIPIAISLRLPPRLPFLSPHTHLMFAFLSPSLFQHTAGQHLVDCINVRCYIVIKCIYFIHPDLSVASYSIR